MRKTKRAIYFNGEYNQFNTGVGLQCITYDEQNGFQFVDGDKVITIATETDKEQNTELSGLTVTVNGISGFVNNIQENINAVSGSVNTCQENITSVSESVNNMQENVNTVSDSVKTCQEDITNMSNSVNSIQKDINTVSGVINNLDYSAFKVQPDDNGNTHNMTIRSEHKKEDCDVIIDWGDGTIESIKESYEFNEGEGYEVSHTYNAAQDENGAWIKYTVKIYGKNYWSFRHEKYKDNNLMCEIFTPDLPIASHIVNFASMCFGATRLKEVKIPHSTSYITNAYNFCSTFEGCINLTSVKGFNKSPLRIDCKISNCFRGCSSLVETDFTIPAGTPSIAGIFYNCSSLSENIQNIIPGDTGLLFKKINVEHAFYGTSALQGNFAECGLADCPDLKNKDNAFESSSIQPNW